MDSSTNIATSRQLFYLVIALGLIAFDLGWTKTADDPSRRLHSYLKKVLVVSDILNRDGWTLGREVTTLALAGTFNNVCATAPSKICTLGFSTSNSASNGPAATTSVTTHAASSGGFTVTAAHGFMNASGQSWSMRGLNATVQDALNARPQIMTYYPGMTTIRLNCYPSTDTLANITKVVQEYNSSGVVVEIEDHSGNDNDVAWYQQMATTFKNNSLVFLETPNEPDVNLSVTPQHQIGIINAIRASGFTNPIGLQPMGGYDEDNLLIVAASVGTTNIFATPHIYYDGTDSRAAGEWATAEIDGSLQSGMFPSIDEFGNAEDGVHLDPQGDTVIQAVIAASEAGQTGAVFWAMDNGNHANGADSACLNISCTQLTSTGKEVQPWLSGNSSSRNVTRPRPIWR